MNVAACATIRNNARQIPFIQRRDLDVWECPGGAAHSDEAPRDAVVRSPSPVTRN
ncbi:MAG: NUDIX hydrolase [Actinomycetota bacterium]